MATERPFAIRFEDGKIHIQLRIHSAESGGDELETPIDVSVVLQPETTSGGHCLRRIVAPEITFADGQRDPVREEFAAMLQRKFAGVFPAEIYFDGLKTPSSGAWSKFLRFELADFSAQQGWFSLAFQLNEDQPNDAIASAVEANARPLSKL
jgi:hypothetical protein